MAGYIGSTPVPQGIKETQSFTATAGQTTFNTLGYSDGNNISVFLNGVHLINGTDYTATNGSDIVLTAAASASDVLDFETFNEFNLVNQNLTTPTFTDSASVTSTTTASVSVSGDTTATLSLKNNTHEDTDGGRESTVIFQGEQSGGEISTLAEIEASHDGTSDDEKGDLIFRTNDGSDGTSPTERLRVDSDGNIGVNINAPSSMLHLFDGGTDTGITLQSKVQANATSSITFMSRKADNSNVNAVLKNVDGRFQSSVGIMFGSDTAAANALEDYEEGTFTPSYTTSSGDASSVVYGTSNAGAYIKIGRLIHFQLTLHITSASSFGSGSPQIHGLPYSSSSSTPVNNALRFTVSTYDVNFDGGAGQTIHAYIPTTNVSYLQILTTNDNTVWVVNNTSAFTLKNNSFTTIHGMYVTN